MPVSESANQLRDKRLVKIIIIWYNININKSYYAYFGKMQTRKVLAKMEG